MHYSVYRVVISVIIIITLFKKNYFIIFSGVSCGVWTGPRGREGGGEEAAGEAAAKHDPAHGQKVRRPLRGTGSYFILWCIVLVKIYLVLFKFVLFILYCVIYAVMLIFIAYLFKRFA